LKTFELLICDCVYLVTEQLSVKQMLKLPTEHCHPVVALKKKRPISTESLH